jgi:hypothetical protein
MNRLKQGDRIICKLRLNKIINADSTDFDEKRIFEIIGLDNYGYYVYVPHYFCLVSTSIVGLNDCKKYNIHSKFIGEEMIYISESLIFSIYSKLDGCFCSKCKDFFHQATAPKDGHFICWSCKSNPYR